MAVQRVFEAGFCRFLLSLNVRILKKLSKDVSRLE